MVGETVYNLVEETVGTVTRRFGTRGTVKGPADNGDETRLNVAFEDGDGKVAKVFFFLN